MKAIKVNAITYFGAIWLVSELLLMVGCAAPAVEVARQEPTTAPLPTAIFPATPVASGAPLLIIGWDDALGRVVRAVDPLTGADAGGYSPLPFAGERDDAFVTPSVLAPDGRWLALPDVDGEVCYPFAGGATCGAGSSTLYLVDLAAWSIRSLALESRGWVGQMVFSRDGRLAVTVQSTLTENSLLLIDPVAGTTLAQTSLPFAPSRLSSGPASTLVVYGQAAGDVAGISPPPAPRVLLLNGATLEPVWETTLHEVNSGHWCVENCDAEHGLRKMTSRVPGVALLPDGERLHIVHADAERLTTVDLARRAVWTIDVAAGVGWLERLLGLTADVAHAKGPMDSFARYAVLSPDGTRLYVSGYDMLMAEDGAGGWGVTETLAPLRVIDPATGHVLAERDVPSHALRLTPDGRTLLALDLSNNATMTTVLDAESLAVVARVEGHHVVTVADMDGETRFVAQSIRHRRTDFTVFEPLTFAVLAEWSADGPAWLVAD